MALNTREMELLIKVRSDTAAIDKVARDLSALQTRTTAQKQVDLARLATQRALNSLNDQQLTIDKQRDKLLQKAADYSQAMRRNVEAQLGNEVKLLQLARQLDTAQRSTTGFAGGRSLTEIQKLQEQALHQGATLRRAQEMLAERSGMAAGALNAQKIAIQDLVNAETKLGTRQDNLIQKTLALGDALNKVSVAQDKMDRGGGDSGGGGDGRGGGGFNFRNPFRGILPGGARPAAGLIATGIGLGIAAGPVLIPAAAGLIMGGASAIGGLVGAAATLKLALGGLNSAALSTQKGWNALTPVQQQLGMTLRRLDAGLMKGLEGIAQGIVIPGLNKGIKSAMTPAFVDALATSVQKFSIMISNVAQSWGKMFGSTQFASAFGQVMQADAGFVQNLLFGLQKMFDAFIHLQQAAIPLTNWMGKGLLHLGNWADKSVKAAQNTGHLTTFFNHAKTALQALGGLLGSMGHLLGSLFDATGFKVGITLVHTLTLAFETLTKFIRANAGIFRSFFMGGILAIHDVIKAIGFLLTSFGPLLRAINWVAKAVGGWRIVFDAILIYWAATFIPRMITALLTLVVAVGTTLPGAAIAGSAASEGAIAGIGVAARAALGPIALLTTALYSAYKLSQWLSGGGVKFTSIAQVQAGVAQGVPGASSILKQLQASASNPADPKHAWAVAQLTGQSGNPNLPSSRGGRGLPSDWLTSGLASLREKIATNISNQQWQQLLKQINANIYGTPDPLKPLPGSGSGSGKVPFSGIGVLPPSMAKAILDAQGKVALADVGKPQLQANINLMKVLNNAYIYLNDKLKDGNLTRKQTLALEKERHTIELEYGAAEAKIDKAQTTIIKAKVNAQNKIYADALSNLKTMYQQFLGQQQTIYGNIFQGPVLTGARMQTITRWGGHASPADLLSDIQAQNFQFRRFNRLVGTLGKRGAPTALLDELRAAGPTAIQDIYNLTKMTPVQWKAYVAAFKSGQSAIQVQTMSQLNSQISLYKQHGIKVAQAIIAGITSQDQQVSAAIVNMLRKSFGLKPAAGYTPGPHRTTVNNNTIHISGHPGDYHKTRAAVRHAMWQVRVHTTGAH